ncbi:hypothetical protein [Crateriforma spongiae]|uniref:hypothetical protein n=1 Tax=Crateriforma spongiae TaxID=2724528 RepID=UPI0039AEEB63
MTLTLATSWTLGTVDAQSPVNASHANQLRPVPKFTAQTQPAATHQPKRAGWNLQWQNPGVQQAGVPKAGVKTTGTDQPAAVAASTAAANVPAAQPKYPVRQVSAIQPSPAPAYAGDRPATPTLPTMRNVQRAGLPAPVPVADPNANQAAANDFFEHPFGRPDVPSVRSSRRARHQVVAAGGSATVTPVMPAAHRGTSMVRQTAAQAPKDLDDLFAPPGGTADSANSGNGFGLPEPTADPVQPSEMRPMNSLRGNLPAPQSAPSQFEMPSTQEAPAGFGDGTELLPPPAGEAFDPGTPATGQAMPRQDLLPPPDAAGLDTNGLDNSIANPDRQPNVQSPSDSIRDLMQQSPSPDSTTSEAPQTRSDNERPTDEGLQTLPPPETTPAPEPQDDFGLDSFDLESNPFERENQDDMDDLRRLREEARKEREERVPGAMLGLSCENFRERVRLQSIRDISLDPSPPFRPDVVEQDRYEEFKSRWDDQQKVRTWRSVDGVTLAVGKLRDLAYGKAIIETEFGSLEEIQTDRLSEEDLAVLTDSWGLPTECQLEQVAYQPRAWQQMTMTYKASNLCHKPLYFQEVNLERYGHTAGPVLQPVVSSAHFFANIAVLPYKMGVHCPSECQYALGYYRPGDCAPWIIPAVPISARGAIAQAAVMTGTFWLVP